MGGLTVLLIKMENHCLTQNMQSDKFSVFTLDSSLRVLFMSMTTIISGKRTVTDIIIP